MNSIQFEYWYQLIIIMFILANSPGNLYLHFADLLPNHISVDGIRTQRQFFEVLCAVEELVRLLFSQPSPEVYAIKFLEVGYMHYIFDLIMELSVVYFVMSC